MGPKQETSMRFDDKVAIVTGAGRGIGRAIADKLISEGAKVMAADIAFAEDVPQSGLLRHRIDLEDVAQIPELVRETVTRLGRIDILVNNAGVEFGGAFFEVTPEEWDRHLNINLRAGFFVTQEVAAWMKDHGGGVVVNIASQEGGLVFSPRFIPYSASKAGVRGMTGAMAAALAPHGIRVNAVAPGWTNTSMSKAGADPLEKAMRLRQIPLNRAGEPSDIAEAVLYLASPQAGYITGQVLAVDGGRTLSVPVGRPLGLVESSPPSPLDHAYLPVGAGVGFFPITG
jgi:NAD(P)-dependent dehydrogenase (short-subunit alcohol dehydrogenase family)